MIDFIKIPNKMKKVLFRDDKGRKNIEKLTNTEISIEEDVKIEGESFNVYQAKHVLKAFGRGFLIKDALSLLDDDYGLEIIDLSKFMNSRNRIKVVKGRIIGKGGKTKELIEKYTQVKLSILGKTVSILGKWKNVDLGKEAVMMVIDGSSHTKLYKWLEQQYSVVRKW
ncbi:MAG: RNA-processing protein [Candidatus Aenigmarchaeota archaeon]|nr:RNA-processing protein [Candidatus Aenigmarchaeota archaeon]